jgi:hypothetical protein
VREVAPGIVHWTARHPQIHSEVSSYLVVDGRVLIDPLSPPEGGFDALVAAYGEPAAVILTNRHHHRHAGELAERYGATVLCHEAGLHEFTHGEQVQGFSWGDELPGGGIAQEVNAICDEETAVWWPQQRALSFADGLVRMGRGAELGFVPDHLIGDDPESVKRGLRAAFARLAELHPEHLLLAHGEPVIGGGRDALLAVAAGL